MSLPGRPSTDERLARVSRSRVFLSLALLPPLLFFVFLVVWFREGFILIPVAVFVYLYMLAQFFIFQNPSFRLRRRPPPRDARPKSPSE